MLSKVFKIIKDLQPLIIVALGLLWYMSNQSKDSFIEDREAKYKMYEDSVKTVSRLLYDETVRKGLENDSIKLANDSLMIRVDSLDSWAKRKQKDYEKNRHTVGTLNANGTVELLSRNLRQHK